MRDHLQWKKSSNGKSCASKYHKIIQNSPFSQCNGFVCLFVDKEAVPLGLVYVVLE